ncbi:MAG TPA: hypothetical protein VMA72_20800 [Streptosporangiaceae bacterium]|nr:hypothetical protein [Streptosporangiaceae bacterium]
MSPRPTSREIRTRRPAVDAATTSWSGPAGEVLARNRVDVVPGGGQDAGRRDRQVLV